MSELFKSDAAKAKVRGWHERFRARVKAPVTSREVQTRFGRTHVLVAGPEGAPAVVALHGAMASSAHLLVELEHLVAKYRVYAVDVIGQSVMSEDTRLSVKNDDYGVWLGEVLDGLGLERVNLLGISWGGFAAQRFAAVAPQRLSKLALLVPAGMVSGAGWDGLVKMGLPMTLFLLAPNEQRLRRFVSQLLTTVDDEEWVRSLGDAFPAYEVRKMVVPKRSKVGEFAALTAPVLVLGAEHDVSFPGAKLVARAKELFPTLADAEVLLGSKHSPPTTDEFRAWLGARLGAFFG